MSKRLISNVLLIAILLIPMPSFGNGLNGILGNQQLAVAQASSEGGKLFKKAKKPLRQYSNVQLGFTVVVPPSAEVRERKGTNQISIRSRKGYVINIQSGPKRPEIPLSRMPSLLEAKYLGEGKPWKTRGNGRLIKVAGMPSHNVTYQGAGSKTRLVIARGQSIDYVFIFIAPEQTFKRLEVEFEWVLNNFKLNPEDTTIQNRQQAAQNQSGAKEIRTQRFSEPGYGYEIEYPSDWDLIKSKGMAATFSGRKGTLDHAAIIGIQNIEPPDASNPNQAAQLAFNQMKTSLIKAVTNFNILEDKAWAYELAGTKLAGRHLLIVYEHAGITFKKRMIVLPRLKGTVVHAWSYTAPQAQYAALQPHAERMLKSWKIVIDKEK